MHKITPYFILLLSLVIFSCSSDDDPETTELSSKKQITSYIIEASKNGLQEDIKAVVNEEAKKITLNSAIPVDKDLIATFQAEGEVYIGSVKQVSGKTTNNMCEQIKYKVVAEDGSSVTYDLIASPETGGEAMTGFKLTIKQKGVDKVIEGEYNHNETVITLKASSNYWIENIESAVAEFQTSGTVYIGEAEQESSVTANDFRKELIYTITSDGKPDRKYRVVLLSPQSTGLPVFKIDTEGGKEIEDKENYINADCMVSDVSNPQYDINQTTGIRGRGNSTWLLYPKKPYRLKFDKKVGLFGLGAAKSWVLRANYQDPTFIMNTVAFEIGQRLGLQFTNHSNHVELFLNGEYKGSYLLTEQVQVNEHRVNIDEDNGFLIELDTYYDEEFKFRSQRLDLPVNVKSPEVGDQSEIKFVQDAFNVFENAMFADNGNPAGNYRDLVDVNSVINYLLINEIVYNGEVSHPKSLYMYKDGNKKMHFGPIWDFDWGFCHEEDGTKYFMETGIRLFNSKSGGDAGKLFAQFFKDPEFRKEYKNHWNAMKPQLYAMDQFITDYGVYLRKSSAENMEVWYDHRYYTFDFDKEIEKMKTWLKNRIDFLDQQINTD